MRKAFYADLAERSVWTFLQAFLAVWFATDAELFSSDSLKVGAVAGLIAVAKALAATRLGDENSASTLPADLDPPRGDHGELATPFLGAVLAACGAVVFVLGIFGVVPEGVAVLGILAGFVGIAIYASTTTRY